jgi:hypothetical protein
VSDVPSDWRRFEHPGLNVVFSYPEVTPTGQRVERRDDEARVHLMTSDRRELYFEVARFSNLTPQDEYEQHRPYLEQRFGDRSVSALSETTLAQGRAWRYDFGGPEGEGRLERSALLVEVAPDTYRIIYDPRSELNQRVLDTVTVG